MVAFVGFRDGAWPLSTSDLFAYREHGNERVEQSQQHVVASGPHNAQVELIVQACILNGILESPSHLLEKLSELFEVLRFSPLSGQSGHLDFDH